MATRTSCWFLFTEAETLGIEDDAFKVTQVINGDGTGTLEVAVAIVNPHEQLGDGDRAAAFYERAAELQRDLFTSKPKKGPCRNGARAGGAMPTRNECMLARGVHPDCPEKERCPRAPGPCRPCTFWHPTDGGAPRGNQLKCDDGDSCLRRVCPMRHPCPRGSTCEARDRPGCTFRHTCDTGVPSATTRDCRDNERCAKRKCPLDHDDAAKPCTLFVHSDDAATALGCSTRLVDHTLKPLVGFKQQHEQGVVVPCVRLVTQFAVADGRPAFNEPLPGYPRFETAPDAAVAPSCHIREADAEDPKRISDGAHRKLLLQLLRFAAHISTGFAGDTTFKQRFPAASPCRQWQTCTQTNFNNETGKWEPKGRSMLTVHRFVTETLMDWFSGMALDECLRRSGPVQGGEAAAAAAARSNPVPPLFWTEYVFAADGPLGTLMADVARQSSLPPSCHVPRHAIHAELPVNVRRALDQVPPSGTVECFSRPPRDGAPGVCVAASFTHPLRDFACLYNLLQLEKIVNAGEARFFVFDPWPQVPSRAAAAAWLQTRRDVADVLLVQLRRGGSEDAACVAARVPVSETLSLVPRIDLVTADDAAGRRAPSPVCGG